MQKHSVASIRIPGTVEMEVYSINTACLHRAFIYKDVAIIETIQFVINNKEITTTAEATVLEAADQMGIHIPRLCYDPELSSYGGCRLCVVEIEGMKNLQASCVTAVRPGMVVHTHSPRVMEARREILGLLLADHPKDCMTCDKMGNCDLADYCYEYGVEKSLFDNTKTIYPLDDSNPFILRDPNKCILCGKCVRACSEIPGIDNLDFAYRSNTTKVTTAGDRPYIESDCTFCGTCVAVCPTGALVEKQMHGKARSWEVKKVKTTCPFCGTGCNFDLVVKDDKVVGVQSNPSSVVNGRALCVKGRFGWDFIYNDKRLTQPLIKRNGSFEPASWEEALDLVASRLLEIKAEHGPDAFAALSSARCTNEDNYLLQKLTRVAMGTNNVDHCART